MSTVFREVERPRLNGEGTRDDGARLGTQGRCTLPQCKSVAPNPLNARIGGH
jgi:hypothetical protein